MMAFPKQPSNQKWCDCLAKTTQNRSKISPMSILYGLVVVGIALMCHAIGAEPPPSGEGHAFEELGVNRYTTPSIARIFNQLDQLKPVPFDQLKSDFPQPAGASREQKSLMFGGLIANGFLLVE